jgi:hypothetical protein
MVRTAVMARRKRAYAGEQLTARIGVKMTPSERRDLEEAAKGQGAPNLSSYARELLFSRSPAVVAAARHNPNAPGLMRELRIAGQAVVNSGNNLNQIARHLNMTGDLRDWRELREALAEHERSMELHKAAVSRVLDL